MNEICVTISGTNRVELAKNLRVWADNLEGAPASKTGKVEAADRHVNDDEDEDFAPKAKATKKAAAAFDDDEEEAPVKKSASKKAATSFDEEDEEEAPVVKKAKAPKLTIDDVIGACKLYAKENGRPATLALLKKKFKTTSVSDLKPEQFAAVIEVMTA